MLKKQITYVDYNGLERTETFYFNLTKTELMTMSLGTEGGLEEKIQKICDAKDMPTIIALFTEIVTKAYGVKSDDGKRLMKGKEISDAFMQSPAYDILFMEIIADEKKAADFIKAVLPKIEEKPAQIPNN